MTKHIGQFLLVMCLIVPTAVQAQGYQAEAEQLIEEIVSTHPDGQRIARTEKFARAAENLKTVSRAASFEKYAMALGSLFHSVDDGHTAAIPLYGEHRSFTLRFPLRVKRFKTGLYVTAAKDGAEQLLGGRLTAINGTGVEEIVTKFAGVSSGGSPAWPMNFVASVAATPGWLVGFEIMKSADEAAVFTAEMPDGQFVSVPLRASADGAQNRKHINRNQSVIEDAGKGSRNFFFCHEPIDQSQSGNLVVHMGTMGDENQNSFGQFAERLMTELGKPEINRVIIDLRQNGGGNNELAEPLRRFLVRSRFNRFGGIYILISPNTFSAAMNFATRLERETDAIFIGEPTGGSPNHFGDAVFKTGNMSGIPYIISTLRWQDSSPFDQRRWILPDIPVDPEFEDFLAGNDKGLDAAISHDGTDDRSVTERIERIVHPWNRSSQKVGWSFFYQPR